MCAACGGQWLDNAAASAILRGELVDPACDLVNPNLQQPPRADGSVAYRQAVGTCPECGAALVPHTTDPARLGVAVALDLCVAHGTWFDRGEAWQLLQALANKRDALNYELQTDLEHQRWARHERAWQSWLIRRVL